MTRITKAGAGETVKVGEDLCVLVPHSRDVAVELWVSGFDTPLLAPGRTVRLIFDGFPAVPFTAWPWASVGTFAGRIKVIDPVDDGSGKYRVLVVPDPTQPDGTWPPATRLRPGARTVGWVMLDNVPLYKEAWRRINAFPPTVDLSAQKEGKGGASYGSDSDKGGDKGGDKAAVKAKPVLKR